MLRQEVDLVVVGAGFAGVACAQAAVVRELKTIVLERKDDPGAGVHTTGLLVKEVADEWDVPRQLTRRVRGVRLYSPSMKWVDLISPGYYFLATDTPALLRWWAARAESAGVEIRYRSPYRGSTRCGEWTELKSYNLRSRFLVGADGAKSQVAENLGLGRNRRFLVGVEVEYEGVRDVHPDRLHVFLDSVLAPGYIAWVVPGVGMTQIGLAGSSLRPDRLDRFVEKLKTVFNFDRATPVARRGGLIPVGGPVQPIGMSGAMLIGDAAGMVSPLTAGGIHTAVHYGRAAGVAVSDHLLADGPSPHRVLQKHSPSFFWKRFLRTGLDLCPPNALYDALLGSSALRSIAQTVFFHHRGMFSPEAWRDIVTAGRRRPSELQESVHE